MVQLTSLTASTFVRLAELERNPEPEPWEAEVEAIILDGAAANHLSEPGAFILAADDDGTVVGASFHYQHEDVVGAQYIAAILVDWRFRRRGYGRALLVQTIEHALQCGRPYVVWSVDPSNEAMIELSREVGVVFDGSAQPGHTLFIDR